MAQHEVEQQMTERLAADRHPELAAVSEVHLSLATGRMLLLEEHLSVPRSGPDSARQSRRRRCSVRSCDTLNRPGCRSSSHSRIVVAFSAPSTSLRRRGSTSSIHTPANGSGRVRHLRFPFLSDGSLPRCHVRAVRTLIPDAAAAPCFDSCLPLASASIALPADL